jgi:hypothetical protein
MVIAILCFVLLTPRSWFHDEARASGSANPGVELVDQDSAGRTRTYRVDAKLLPPEKRTAKTTPELERETHDILGGNVDDLKNHTFQVLRIDPVKDDRGAVQRMCPQFSSAQLSSNCKAVGLVGCLWSELRPRRLAARYEFRPSLATLDP